jgi:tetratricopeptide (TPR) repeat protein
MAVVRNNCASVACKTRQLQGSASTPSAFRRDSMARLLPFIVSLIVAAACRQAPEAPRAPLYENVGRTNLEITTSSPDARRYFDQGMAFAYGFNHAEAVRAFRQAAAIDPSCAMCYWGVAYALGPNINAPITEDAAKEAFAAIEQARMHSGDVSEREQAYIAALARRYVSDPRAERAPLDEAYAQAMREVVKRYPDDLDAATLFAQSLMDTAPWNYWNRDGSPRSFTNEVLGTLESVLKRNGDHIGAIHLYIHAVEASPNPGRATEYADRLAALAPAAGHLVHMPAHIYLRVGRYADASAANQRGLAADAAYFAGSPVPGNMMYQVGYSTHNPHFFVTSASMEGRRADALRAAEDVKARMHADMLRDPAMGGMVQHMQLTPLFTKMRFALWDQVLAEPEPAADLPYMRAIWHTARGMAHAAAGRAAEAEKERVALAALKDDPSLEPMYVSSVNTAASIAEVAHEVLSGEIALAARRPGDVVRHYAAAATLEDGLTYMEPPDWPLPVRQLQGAALLASGRAREAEQAFRQDLQKFPANGWSLSGLLASLERQGRAADAAAVREQFTSSWKAADVKMVAARPQP